MSEVIINKKYAIKKHDTESFELFETNRTVKNIMKHDDGSIYKLFFDPTGSKYMNQIWINKNSIFFKLFPTVKPTKKMYYKVDWKPNGEDSVLFDHIFLGKSDVSEDKQVSIKGNIDISDEEYNKLQTVITDASTISIECYIEK